MNEPQDHAERVTVEEPPPLLGTWARVYLFVVCYLACLVVVFYFFARILNS